MENTTKKVTKKEMLERVVAHLNDTDAPEELVTCIQHEIELLNNKNKAKAKERTTEEQNFLTAIVEVLEDANAGLTATEISQKADVLSNLSTPKMVALLKVLKEENKVVQAKVGKRSEFSVVR